MSRARVVLVQGDSNTALTILKSLRQQAEVKGWVDERLRILVLQALVFQAKGDTDQALIILGEALALTESEGIIRLYVDEGLPMLHLLAESNRRGIASDYTARLITILEVEQNAIAGESQQAATYSLPEPLSRRELEILQFIAEGLSNQAISEKLFLALDTVKGHNRRIFDKLQVQRRTEAVARARTLRLI